MTAPSIKEALETLRDANMSYSLVSDAKNARRLEQAMRDADAALAAFQPDGERREAIARAISWLRKFRFMSYNTGFLWMADDAEKIASLLESLASGLVQDEAGWRDISTAPKDGTDILAWWGGGKIHSVVHWFEGWWVENDDERGVSPPTHWKPLDPGPPIRSASDGGAET